MSLGQRDTGSDLESGCPARTHSRARDPLLTFASQLCRSDQLWERIVETACEVTPDMRALAGDIGWRQMFFTKAQPARKRKQSGGSEEDRQL